MVRYHVLWFLALQIGSNVVFKLLLLLEACLTSLESELDRSTLQARSEYQIDLHAIGDARYSMA